MLFELARKRKTVRKFADNKVMLEDILYCLNVAREAPSGMNAQPWRFVIVDDEEIKAKIREICEKGEREFYRKVGGNLKKMASGKKFLMAQRFS